PRRQRHRPAQPAIGELRHQRSLARHRPHRPGPHGLDPVPLPRRRTRPSRTHTAPLLPLPHRRRHHPPRTTHLAPPRRRMALGTGTGQRLPPTTNPPVRSLTTTSAPPAAITRARPRPERPYPAPDTSPYRRTSGQNHRQLRQHAAEPHSDPGRSPY